MLGAVGDTGNETVPQIPQDLTRGKNGRRERSPYKVPPSTSRTSWATDSAQPTLHPFIYVSYWPRAGRLWGLWRNILINLFREKHLYVCHHRDWVKGGYHIAHTHTHTCLQGSADSRRFPGKSRRTAQPQLPVGGGCGRCRGGGGRNRRGMGRQKDRGRVETWLLLLDAQRLPSLAYLHCSIVCAPLPSI